MSALVIALHGSRHPGAVVVAAGLQDAVASRLPGVKVFTGYVDVLAPHVADVLAGLDEAVVVPAFVTAGYHVDSDLPAALAASGVRGSITPHVGPRLLDAVAGQLAEAGGPGDAVVLIAAGSRRPGSVAEVKAAAAALEVRLGVPVRPGFLSAAAPAAASAVAGLVAEGYADVSVAPFVIAPGLFEERLHGLGAARVAAPVGVHPLLVDAVVAEFRAAFRAADVPAYLSGLDLAGRRVLVAGAGTVATRRIAGLLEAGADVLVVGPSGTPQVARWAADGQLVWARRTVAESDVNGAWYVVAATDDRSANDLVGRAAEARRTFCVRADAAASGSARTPAVGFVDGLAVGVVGERAPRRSAAARGVAAAAVAAWSGADVRIPGADSQGEQACAS